MAAASAAFYFGFFAFSFSPLAILLCLSLLATRGCCGLLRLRRFHLLLAAFIFTALSWAAAACTKWGAALLGPALTRQLRAGSVLVAHTEAAEFSVLVAPLLFAVALGCFALLTVGAKLYRFNDCEEASAELTEVGAVLAFACCCCFVIFPLFSPIELMGLMQPPSPPHKLQNVEAVKKVLRRKGFKRDWAH